MFKQIGIIIVLLIGFQSPAYAYLDLGTGSYMIQVIIAGFVAFLFFAKSFFLKIKIYWNRFFGKKDDGSGKTN